MIRQLIIDTNFFLIPYQFKVDIFYEFQRMCNFRYECAAFFETVRELNNIINTDKGNRKRAAKLGLSLLNAKEVKVIHNRKLYKSADEAIIANSNANSVVATQDIVLKKKLKEKGISIIVLRQKKYLILEE